MLPNNHHQPNTHHQPPNVEPKPKRGVDVKQRIRLTPKWLLAVLAAAGTIIIFGCALLLWFLTIIYAVRTNVSVNGEIFEVKSGESVSQIASNLAARNLIESPTAFEIYAKFGPSRGQLIPGPYLVRPSSSIASIISDMAAGHIAQDKITYPEGITIADMAMRYAAAGYGSKDEYIAAAKSQAPNYSFIPASGKSNPEGYLFPSTYKFIPGRGADELVRKQYQAFESEMLPLLNSNRPAGLNQSQVLTLASIVEKEALTTKDRKLTAGVFINRLARGMKLESDVTVNYATGKKTTSPADLSVISPYNTYKVLGLPPTPINNPGTESVDAVLNYTPNDYIFFLAGTDGVVYYAKTLQEHNQNIKNHL